MIPYVITEMVIDNNKPNLRQIFGVIKEEKIEILETYFTDKICNYILDRDNIVYEEDIDKFFKKYHNDYYMVNNKYNDKYDIVNFPWSASVYINDDWQHILPTNTEKGKKTIWKNILLSKIKKIKTNYDYYLNIDVNNVNNIIIHELEVLMLAIRLIKSQYNQLQIYYETKENETKEETIVNLEEDYKKLLDNMYDNINIKILEVKIKLFTKIYKN